MDLSNLTPGQRHYYKRLMMGVSLTLTTLLEVDGGGPESSFYMAYNSDIDFWNDIKSLMLKSKLITVSNNWVKITEKGKEIATECENVIKKTEELKQARVFPRGWDKAETSVEQDPAEADTILENGEFR